MRTTTANLKHLYQCRGFWWYYVVIAMFVSQMVFNEREAFGWLWIGMLNLMAGIGISLLQKEILSRPFAYCLPGHRPMPRRLIFGFGVVFNLLLLLPAMFRKDLADYNTVIAMLCAFSFGLTVYLVTILCGLIPRNANLFPVVIIGFMATLLIPKEIVDDLATGFPVLLPAIAVIVVVVTWLLLQSESLARKLYGQPALYFSTPNKAAQRKARQAAYGKRQNDSPPWIHEFFIKRIGSFNHAATVRSIWSDLYLAFAKPFSRWKDTLIVLSVVAVGAAYLSTFTRDVDDANSPIMITIAVVMSLAAMAVRLPLYSDTPPFASRELRLYGAVSVAGATTLLMIIMLFVIAAATILLEQILPSFFAAMPQIQIVLLPIATVPAILILHLCIKSQSVKSALIIALFFVCSGLLIRTESLFVWMLITSISAWTAFILIARHVCARRCLVQ